MTETKLIISGPVETKEVMLNPKGTTLGRGSNCDVILDDAAVSRLHARISQDAFGRWIVEDIDSQNGILVEGQHIKAQAIMPDQKINIRPFTLSILQDSNRHAFPGMAPKSTILIVDKALERDIVSYKTDQATILSPALIHDLN